MRHKGDQLPEVRHARAATAAAAGTTEGSDCEPPGSGPATEHLEVRAGPPWAASLNDTGAHLYGHGIQAKACCCCDGDGDTSKDLLKSETNVDQGENRKEVDGNLCHFSSLDGAEDPFSGKTYFAKGSELQTLASDLQQNGMSTANDEAELTVRDHW